MGDIDTVVVDSLKVLDPERPIREADILKRTSKLAVALSRISDKYRRTRQNHDAFGELAGLGIDID